MNVQRKKLLVALTAFALIGADSAHAQSVPATSNPAPAVKARCTAQVTGRVVDENGQPVIGVGVRAVISSADFARLTGQLYGTSRGKDGKILAMTYEGPPPEDVIGRNMVNANATTRADGTYTFDGLTTGHYYLMGGGNLNPGRVTSLASVDARDGQTVQAPDIVVSNGVLLRGQIVDKETGAPLPGLVLRYFDATHPPDSEWMFSPARNGRHNLVTDANGRFELIGASGQTTFFIAGMGWTFGLSDLVLSPQQRTEASVPGPTPAGVLGVKSGQNFYASDIWVEVSEDGGPLRRLARSQWMRTTIPSKSDKTLLFRLQKLVFKKGNPPQVPVLSLVYEGDPRK